MLLMWALAFLMSFALRLWGLQHPEPFLIRFPLVFFLLFGPVALMGGWIAWNGFQRPDQTSLLSGTSQALKD